MATFNLAPSSSSSLSSDESGDDDKPLPFPAALPRADFLAPDFSAAEYLSSLPHRHQTLEDLRGDLRERGTAIGAELLELVNAHYDEFLSLGDDLRGGGERVEDVRVAVLGFRRAVADVRARVADRRGEVVGLNEELRGIRRQVEMGRRMLELDERVAAVEDRLAVGSGGTSGTAVAGTGNHSDDLFDDESDDEGDDGAESDEDETGTMLVGTSPAKMATLVGDLSFIEALADSIGRDTPFVLKMEERILRCRNTILLDLGNALKESKSAGVVGQGRLLRYLGLYSALDAEKEVITALKAS